MYSEEDNVVSGNYFSYHHSSELGCIYVETEQPARIPMDYIIYPDVDVSPTELSRQFLLGHDVHDIIMNCLFT